MASHFNNEDYSPIIKNTFISLAQIPRDVSPRGSSVPPSSRLCRDGLTSFYDGSFRAGLKVSDLLSADADTEASTCSECALECRTPMSFDGCCSEEGPPSVHAAPCDFWLQNSCFIPPPPAMHSVARSEVAHQGQRLNAKALAFQPQVVAEAPTTQDYKHLFADVVHRAKQTVESSQEVASVEISWDAGGWSFMIKPHGGDKWNTEQLTTLAKRALIDAAAKSRCIYFLGYCAPNPCIMKPQGFEATLAVMESSSAACWHIFKKGFCRHGAHCRTQHPVSQEKIHVLVEGVQESSCPRIVQEFKQEIANLALAVTSELKGCPYADNVEAYRDKDCPGWTIEVTPKEELQPHKDYLLTLAKSALFSASNCSNTVYIMGYNAKPFVSKSSGFVTILGDLQDESVVCWDFYSKGVCTRNRDCKWKHPNCYVPLNVVMKKKLSVDVDALKAVLQSLVVNVDAQVRN